MERVRRTDDVNVKKLKPLIPTSCLTEDLPASVKAAETVYSARATLKAILHNEDDRLFVVIGPNKNYIHPPISAADFQTFLQNFTELSAKYKSDLVLLTRLDFSQPAESNLAYQGLLSDPELDPSLVINQGLREARRKLLQLNEEGIPVTCSFYDTISPQFMTDLISWGYFSEELCESPVHRELASGLSCPVGFVSPSGRVKAAVQAVKKAKGPHHFLGVTKEGLAAIVSTTGNENSHIILRGIDVIKGTSDEETAENIVADCTDMPVESQLEIITNVGKLIEGGRRDIVGVMMEGQFVEGEDKVERNPSPSWVALNKALRQLSEGVKKRRTPDF